MTEQMKLKDSTVYKQDIKSIVNWNPAWWNGIAGYTVLVTGATGLIGSLIVSTLLEANKEYDLGLRIHCIARNGQLFREMFGEDHDDLILIETDIMSAGLPTEQIDLLFHCASITSSEAFVQTPVEVLNTNIIGTKRMLDLAREKETKRFIYLSTMEVYGTPQDDTGITEDRMLEVRSDAVRSCYPISKIACENLCRAYASEYGVPVNVFRLTQTFGAGVRMTDNRLFAYLAKCVLNGQDIVLKTKGETKRNYLYTTDAVKAVYTVIGSEATVGETYNIANEDTYCSVYEMARLVAELGNISVEANLGGDTGMYAPVLHMNLRTDKIKALGWSCEIGLKEMFERLTAFFREQMMKEDQ